MSSRPVLFRLRRRSLARGVLLAVGALAVSLSLVGLPLDGAPHASVWQFAPAFVVFCGMIETARCLGRRWTFYHAGVVLLLYAELMILVLSLFFWVYL